MQTSTLLLFLVALYPCGAAASLAVPFALAPLNRWMRENEDPRVAKAWGAVGICAVGALLAAWLVTRAPSSDVVILRLGGQGFTVDQNGPLAAAMLSLLGLLSAIAMLPQTPGLRHPTGWLLLAVGAGVLALTTEDVRVALAALELALLFLSLTQLTDTDAPDSRKAALRWFLVAQPGVAALAFALLGLAGRAGTPVLGEIRDATALEVAANVAAARWILLGAAWLLTVPALPWALRDVLSRRTLASGIALLGLGGALVGWAMLRLAFSALPYAECWDLARRGGLVIPLLALAASGLLVASALTRGPSPRVLRAVAATGPLLLLGFCLGRPAFPTALALLLGIPLVRVGLLAAQVADPARRAAPPSGGLLRRLHAIGLSLACAGLVVAVALLVPRFVQGWYRVLFALLLVAPAAAAAYRMARFAHRERGRRHGTPAWLAAGASIGGLCALLAWGPVGALSSSVERELGLDLGFGIQHRLGSQGRGQSRPAPEPPANLAPLPGAPRAATPPGPGTPPPPASGRTPSAR